MWNRRCVLAMLASLPLSGGSVRVLASGVDARAALEEMARALASRPHQPLSRDLPPPFSGLGYSQYVGIRPRPGGAADLPLGDGHLFDLLPPGFVQQDRVTIEVRTPGGIVRHPFSTGLFSFDEHYFRQPLPELGNTAAFSGFRLRGTINSPGRMDEYLVMQGASYFRAVPAGGVYGLSARALSIGTGGAEPEEFPRIVLVRLTPSGMGSDVANEYPLVEAVFDSPSAAGVLRLSVAGGAETVTDAELTVFPRTDIPDAGIAPLTSMYFMGGLRRSVADDFRPAVHDSDALSLRNGAGEWLWRPLSNPATLQTSAFADDGPRSFALVQSRRRFGDFEDSEARYHLRPSARVEPLGEWGPGSVMLVEIPTADEYMDNIVAFWRPRDPLRAGQAYRYAYRLVWTLRAAEDETLAPVVQSLSGHDPAWPGARRYVVDFAVTDPATQLRPDASATGAEIVGIGVFPVPDRGLRVTFIRRPFPGSQVAELRLRLVSESGSTASAVWLHRWTPTRDGTV
jgi:glucans biosynthesis protein